MRAFLASRVGPGAIADALELVSHRPDRAIGIDPIGREVAGAVIRRVEILSRRMDFDVGRELTVRRGGVDECQVSVCRVDRISAHAPGSIFVDGIKMNQRWVKRDKRWVRRWNDLQGRQPAIARVHPEYVNANRNARVRSAGRHVGSGVRPYINESRQSVGWSAGCPTGRGIEYARGSSGHHGCTEQRKKLATSQARRRRFLVILELFR